MIPDCDGRSDVRTESIMARTALCIASYADALSKMDSLLMNCLLSLLRVMWDRAAMCWPSFFASFFSQSTNSRLCYSNLMKHIDSL